MLYVYPLLVLLFSAGVSAGAFFYATRAEYGKHNLQATRRTCLGSAEEESRKCLGRVEEESGRS